MTHTAVIVHRNKCNPHNNGEHQSKMERRFASFVTTVHSTCWAYQKGSFQSRNSSIYSRIRHCSSLPYKVQLTEYQRVYYVYFHTRKNMNRNSPCPFCPPQTDQFELQMSNLPYSTGIHDDLSLRICYTTAAVAYTVLKYWSVR